MRMFCLVTCCVLFGASLNTTQAADMGNLAMLAPPQWGALCTLLLKPAATFRINTGPESGGGENATVAGMTDIGVSRVRSARRFWMRE